MAEPKQSGEPIPVQFGKYLLDGEIARGGMSRVYRARLRGPGGFEKKLVVKQILPHLAQDPSFIELFVREANTLVQMSHGNIVPVYELGVVDGVYFLAMELVPGATVAELLRDGPLPQGLVAQIGAQVCEALRYAHERFELVHRDVTPRNVMVDSDGHVRLLDFGIAAPLARTGQGERFGSPGYMSPEQASGRTLAAQSDLFSLGAVLYEALTGERAIPRGTEGDAGGLPNQLSAATDSESGGGFDAVLCELVNGLLEVDPAARPASAAQVADRLRRWIAEHHPGGVAAGLGQRARAASERLTHAASAAPDSAASEGDTSGTPQLTRSIATSKALDAIIAQVTEPLPGRGQAEPVSRTTPLAPRRSPLRAALWPIVALCLAAGVYWAEQGARDDQAADAHGRTVVVSDGSQAAREASETGQQGAATGTSRDDQARAGSAAASAGNAATALPATTGAPAASASTQVADSRASSPAAVEEDTATTRAATAPDSVAAPATPRKEDNGQASVGRARLTVNALPWATLRLDGKALGNTPQRALPVSAGKHVLVLDCPPLGKQANVPLTLESGAHARIVVDMQQSPPKVTRR